MSKNCQFHQAVSRLVQLHAAATLDYVLDEARAIDHRALLTLSDPTAHLIVLDENDNIYAINVIACSHLNTTDPVGCCLWDLMPAHVAALRRNIVALVRQQRAPLQVLDNLTDHWYDTTVEPVDTLPGGVLIRAVDVTEGLEFCINDGCIQFVAPRCQERSTG